MSDKLSDLHEAGLPEDALRDAGAGYLEEPRGRWHGQAVAIVAPRSTDEVVATLRACSATGTPVIPYGGGTGLVGGQLTDSGPAPVILSLERMRAIRDLDPAAGIVTVGSTMPSSSLIFISAPG